MKQRIAIDDLPSIKTTRFLDFCNHQKLIQTNLEKFYDSIPHCAFCCACVLTKHWLHSMTISPIVSKQGTCKFALGYDTNSVSGIFRNDMLFCGESCWELFNLMKSKSGTHKLCRWEDEATINKTIHGKEKEDLLKLFFGVEYKGKEIRQFCHTCERTMFAKLEKISETTINSTNQPKYICMWAKCLSKSEHEHHFLYRTYIYDSFLKKALRWKKLMGHYYSKNRNTESPSK